MDRCQECGFAYGDWSPTTVYSGLLGVPPGFRAALGDRSDPWARTRPAPDTWSPVEYVAHVRDVVLVQRERVIAAVVDDRPDVSPMHRDERVELCDYASLGLAAALDQLEWSVGLFVQVLAHLPPGGWERSLRYNWPEPAIRSVHWLAVHVLHECRHHLRDARPDDRRP